MANYVVTNIRGLNVRAQMDTQNDKNILRKMSKGEGFVVHQTYQVKGSTGLQTWGRISNNPGGVTQEFVCLKIGNTEYAKAETPVSDGHLTLEERVERIEAFLNLGYRD